jgi:CheY-like chemotaxis protein
MAIATQQVLIIEDDAEMRTCMTQLLRDEGYTAQELSDGKPALHLLRRSQDRLVVLLDLHMPGMDGRALLHTVAADVDLARRHAYVLVTADARTLPLDFAKFLTRLGVRVVAKPFDIDDLLQVVAQAAARLVG